MAIIERPIPATTTPTGPVVTPSTSLGVFRRPVSATGWRSWLFTVDHKKLGIMYGVTAMAFFVLAMVLMPREVGERAGGSPQPALA